MSVSESTDRGSQRPPLRFDVGTEVLCRVGPTTEWEEGRVTEHWYSAGGGQLLPYKIQLHQSGTFVMAPEDDDICIKLAPPPPPPGFFQFRSGFINDDFSKQCEPIQGRPFLYTGRAPEVGQRTEVAVHAGGEYCRLSGVVSSVGEVPTFDQWVTTSSIAPPPGCCDCKPADPYAMLHPDTILGFGDCTDPSCLRCEIRQGRKEMSLGELWEGSRQLLGALSGQVVTVYAYLNFDYFHKQGELPFQRGEIYRIILKVDDSKMNVWCATSIENISDLPVSEFPQVFRDWTEGQKAAGAPPFDLPELQRRQWFERIWGENERKDDFY